MTRALTIFAVLLALAACGERAGNETAVPGGPFILVLGIAQDAGYPQAACYLPHCLPGWEDPALRRSATSIAVVDPVTDRTYLFEATPHMPRQLYVLERDAPSDRFTLGGVFLTHGHIGHYTGLMHFGHEVMGARGIPVYAMPRMRAFLASNGPWDQLVRYENVVLRPLEDGIAEELPGGITVTPFLVPHRDEYTETVGFRIDGPNRSAVFIPDIDKWERWEGDLAELVRDVDYAFLDATFYQDGEIPGRAMEDIPHPFVVETMALLEGLSPAERARVHFIHFNHTNPLLMEGAAERDEVEGRGYGIAAEGQRLPL